MGLTPEDFGSSFRDFMQTMSRQAPAEEPPFLKRLTEHFGKSPTPLPVISEAFPRHEHANVQLALDSLLARPAHSHEALGLIQEHGYLPVTLSQLVAPAGAMMFGSRGTSEGPVEWENIACGEETTLACVKRGLFLVNGPDGPLAVLVSLEERYGPVGHLKLEVMAQTRQTAEDFLRDLRQAIRQRNIYRGKVISLGQDDYGQLNVKFHTLPQVDRGDIILPEGVLERVERQTLRFAAQREKLKAGQRHLKRGLLLHGPPGTGKTLSAMYLAAAMQDHTVILLTGRDLGTISQSCALARMLQPAILVLEDVDLIAEERTHASSCAVPLLFELLNEMDGLTEDAEIVFLLTTNRPDILEPALAARPGRIDQAVEIPLPDEICRRRLFELYGEGLTIEVDDLEQFLRRTEGASAAFIRELLRKAALFAADDSDDGNVRDAHLDAALHELVVAGGQLTKSLLGFQSSERAGFR